MTRRACFGLVLAVPVFAVPASAAVPGDRPAFVIGDVVITHYDGVGDDLLTGGIGATGLGSATPPPLSVTPTVAELRRRAIWTNYRALVDPTPGGGYGTFYGPNVATDGSVTTSEGLIAGTEMIALARRDGTDPAAGHTFTVMVQIPDAFDPAHACIVTAPSPGSRGIYGAIATAGEWGLKHHCAVAYTDKGTGVGTHDLRDNLVETVQGKVISAATAGEGSLFTARMTETERVRFDARYPHRFAPKHAFSQVNPEADWGRDELDAIRFAFWALGRTYGAAADGHPRITRTGTVVIASSVSNGGGTSLRAVEQDTDHLIDGVAVSEPNVQPVFDDRFTIVQGNGTPLVRHSRPLIDYVTLENVYVPCAAVQYPTGAELHNLAASPERCAALHAAGLLASDETAQQAVQAQQILNDFGILPEQNYVAPSHWAAYVHQSIAVTYANAYGRFSVLDGLCGYGMGAVDGGGHPVAMPEASVLGMFGNSSGVPPTGGISLINDAVGLEDRVSTPDQDLHGALCLRGLAMGVDAVTGAKLDDASAPRAERIARGVAEVRATGDLHGTPAIWVDGRSDGFLPPNFTSRAYWGRTQVLDGTRGTAHYIEVTNAQHVDSFNVFPGYDSTLIPLQVYFLRAMDLMYAHLTAGTPLPPSQVVHTVPRGPGAPPLTAANVPPIDASPDASALITFTGNQVRIPE